MWFKKWLNQTHTDFSDLPKRSLAQKPKLPTTGTFSFIQKPVTLVCSSPRARQTCAGHTRRGDKPHTDRDSVSSPYKELSLQQPFFTSLSESCYKDNVFSLAFSSATVTFKTDWPGCDNYTSCSSQYVLNLLHFLLFKFLWCFLLTTPFQCRSAWNSLHESTICWYSI